MQIGLKVVKGWTYLFKFIAKFILARVEGNTTVIQINDPPQLTNQLQPFLHRTQTNKTAAPLVAKPDLHKSEATRQPVELIRFLHRASA